MSAFGKACSGWLLFLHKPPTMNLRLAVVVLLLAACAQPPAPKVTPTRPQPPPARSSNALTPVASVAKTIVEPRIRVGLLSDQTSVTFPRIEGGYYVIAESGASTLRRGFTVSAPLSETVVRYAVQTGAISDKPSAETFATRLRTDTGQRVDLVRDELAATGQSFRALEMTQCGRCLAVDERQPAVHDRHGRGEQRIAECLGDDHHLGRSAA